jgi:DNA polymerase-3 subunit epsilon
MWFFRKKKSVPPLADAPAFWQNYQRQRASMPDLDRPLDSVRFVVLDIETTGLDVKQDQLLSVGAVAVQGGAIQVEDRFECLVHQEYLPRPETISIHGIVPRPDSGSLEEKQALKALIQYLGPAVLVGHHLSFDLLLINTLLRDWLGDVLYNRHLDTERLARRIAPPNAYAGGIGRYGLDVLCEEYGIRPHDQHTAAGDAYLTALLFLKLVWHLQKRGATTLKHLVKRTGN